MRIQNFHNAAQPCYADTLIQKRSSCVDQPVKVLCVLAGQVNFMNRKAR